MQTSKNGEKQKKVQQINRLCFYTKKALVRKPTVVGYCPNGSLPSSLEPHCHGFNDWIFRKQCFDVVSERKNEASRQ